MTNDPLETTAQALTEASDAATDDDVAQRLESQASQFESMAEADRGPDHGKLARHEHILNSIADDEGGDVAEHIEDALTGIKTYRETLEGV